MFINDFQNILLRIKRGPKYYLELTHHMELRKQSDIPDKWYLSKIRIALNKQILESL